MIFSTCLSIKRMPFFSPDTRFSCNFKKLSYFDRAWFILHIIRVLMLVCYTSRMSQLRFLPCPQNHMSLTIGHGYENIKWKKYSCQINSNKFTAIFQLGQNSEVKVEKLNQLVGSILYLHNLKIQWLLRMTSSSFVDLKSDKWDLA